jgi:hypothetical protein
MEIRAPFFKEYLFMDVSCRQNLGALHSERIMLPNISFLGFFVL